MHRHNCVIWGYMSGKTGESVIAHFELVAEGIVPSTVCCQGTVILFWF